MKKRLAWAGFGLVVAMSLALLMALAINLALGPEYVDGFVLLATGWALWLWARMPWFVCSRLREMPSYSETRMWGIIGCGCAVLGSALSVAGMNLDPLWGAQVLLVGILLAFSLPSNLVLVRSK